MTFHNAWDYIIVTLSKFHPIGLLAVSLLLFLCWHRVYQNFLREKSYNVLEVNYWNPERSEYDPYRAKYLNKCFMKITLDGSSHDRIKLQFARRAIRELVRQTGPIRGIEFTITDGAKYSSWVKLFNICLLENAHTYLHYRDKFFVFNR